MHYVRNNPFGRRNAEGVSLQFYSKGLRERIAGKFYVELDIKSPQPPMLRTRLAWLGKIIRTAPCGVGRRQSGMCRADQSRDSNVRELILAAINGAIVEMGE